MSGDSVARTILVDCDGVLSDMTGAVLTLARRQGIYATPEDVTSWDYGEAIGWKDWRCFVDKAVAEDEFCYWMQAYDGAFPFLRRLEGMCGVENVLICTSPWTGKEGPAWVEQRLCWLRDVMHVGPKRIITCSRKELVTGFLIDDSPDHLAERRYGDNHWCPWAGSEGFCVARPYNTEYTGQRGSYNDCLKQLFTSFYRPELAGAVRNLP